MAQATLATRKAKTPQRSPDLILMDLALPAKSGTEIYRSLRQRPFYHLYLNPDRIVRGLPFRLLSPIASSIGISADDLAKRIGVSRSTFHRRVKAPDSLLSSQESDALARFGMLMEKATETFDGDKDAARQWLATAQPGLGNAIPLAMAQTTPGFREVEKLLTRIDLGVYA